MPERFVPTRMIDAKLELLLNVPPLKSRDLVHLHVGTSEVMARVVLYGRNEIKAGETCYCQFRLQEHVIAMSGDRYIIRSYSPVETIGGGEVYDPSSHKMSHKKSMEDLKIFETRILADKISVKVKRSGIQGIDATLIEGWVSADSESIKEAIELLKKEGTVRQFESILIHKTTFDSFREIAKKLVQDFHRRNPLKPGIQKEELRSHIRLKPKLFDQMLTVLEDVIADRDIVKLHTFKIALSEEDTVLRKTILEILGNAEFQPLTAEELLRSLRADEKYLAQIVKLMVKEGSLIKINDSLYLPSFIYERMLGLLKAFSGRKPEMLVSEFREMLGTSRKYALLFLEYLDANRITKKTDEKRFLSSRVICNI